MLKVASKVRRGREPLRQLPGKWSSDIVCTGLKISWKVMAARSVTPTILHVHFHCWPVRRFAHPYVEIFSFPSFEEEHIIAIVEFC